MRNGTQDVNLCKSVFKAATDDTRALMLTQRWIELINRLEQQSVWQPVDKGDKTLMKC